MAEESSVTLLSEAEKEALKFLERDFNQCFQQMRHYDGQILDIVKFMFTAYASLVGVALGLYQFGLKERFDLTLPAVVAVVVGLVLGLFLYTLAVRNRVYFVQVARYVNEQRRFFFRYRPLGFANESGMYTDHRQPPLFNWRSSEAWYTYMIAALNSILLSVLLFVALSPPYRIWGIVFGSAGLLATQLWLGIRYLRLRERRTAGEAAFA